MHGITFKNQAQLLYNAARIGFNSKLNVATGVPNLKNIKYDIFNSDTATTKTGCFFDNTNKIYTTELPTDGTGMNVYDEFNDASINTELWTASTSGTTGSNTETGGYLEIKATTGAAIQNGTATVVSKSELDDYIVIKVNTFSSTRSPSDANKSGYCKFYITDGTSSTTLKEINITTNTTISNKYFILKKLGNTLHYKIADDDWASTSVSGWGALKIGFEAQTGSAISLSSSQSTIQLDFVRTFPIGNTSLIFQTTSLPTITDCIPTWNSSIDSENTLTVSISADGTNYEEVTDATIHRFTNTGTNLFIKFEIDRVDTSAVDKISEYAILYNCTGEV